MGRISDSFAGIFKGERYYGIPQYSVINCKWYSDKQRTFALSGDAKHTSSMSSTNPRMEGLPLCRIVICVQFQSSLQQLMWTIDAQHLSAILAVSTLCWICFICVKAQHNRFWHLFAPMLAFSLHQFTVETPRIYEAFAKSLDRSLACERVYACQTSTHLYLCVWLW